MSYPPMSLGSELKFGKWKGYTIEHIIENDINYLRYMVTVQGIIKLDNEAHKEFSER